MNDNRENWKETTLQTALWLGNITFVEANMYILV